MKNKKSVMIKQIVIFIFISLFLNNILVGQSLKKTFKHIENNEVGDAIIAYQKIGNLKTEEDKFLWGIASSLLLSEEEFSEFDPYKALKTYELTLNINANRMEVEKFLERYQLDLEKIELIIFENIFRYAKKINTEESYQAALGVCSSCFYKQEVVKLKEDLAYHEAKKANSISAYRYFIFYYPNSQYIPEIQELLNDKVFLTAKSEMSLTSLNNYLNEFSNSLYKKNLSLAIHLRDSIAFFSLEKSYYNFNNYLKNYPNSYLNNTIIEKLPELLYNQVVKEHTIDGYELFLKKYPNDINAGKAKDSLEILYYKWLLSNNSLIEFEKFNNRFPNSKFTVKLLEIYSRLIEKNKLLLANNDLKKARLKGKVKDIKISKYNYPSDNPDTYNIRYNQMGYLLKNDGLPWYDKAEQFLKEYISPEVSNRDLIFGLNDDFSNAETFESFFSRKDVNFEYDDTGHLLNVSDGEVKWVYTYDIDGNLITKDVLRPSRNFRIKYNWVGGKLISKKVYDNNGDLHQDINIEYPPSMHAEKIENVIDKSTHRQIRITTENDFQNRMSSKKVEVFWSDKLGARTEYSYFYNFDNNELEEIGIVSEVRHDTNGRDNPYLTVEWDGTIKITRDKEGNILYFTNNLIDHIKTRNSYTKEVIKLPTIVDKIEWAYKYDSIGNWIERTEYEIKKNDITVKKIAQVEKRQITYY